MRGEGIVARLERRQGSDPGVRLVQAPAEPSAEHRGRDDQLVEGAPVGKAAAGVEVGARVAAAILGGARRKGVEMPPEGVVEEPPVALHPVAIAACMEIALHALVERFIVEVADQDDVRIGQVPQDLVVDPATQESGQVRPFDIVPVHEQPARPVRCDQVQRLVAIAQADQEGLADLADPASLVLDDRPVELHRDAIGPAQDALRETAPSCGMEGLQPGVVRPRDRAGVVQSVDAALGHLAQHDHVRPDHLDQVPQHLRGRLEMGRAGAVGNARRRQAGVPPRDVDAWIGGEGRSLHGRRW